METARRSRTGRTSLTIVPPITTSMNGMVLPRSPGALKRKRPLNTTACEAVSSARAGLISKIQALDLHGTGAAAGAAAGFAQVDSPTRVYCSSEPVLLPSPLRAMRGVAQRGSSPPRVLSPQAQDAYTPGEVPSQSYGEEHQYGQQPYQPQQYQPQQYQPQQYQSQQYQSQQHQNQQYQPPQPQPKEEQQQQQQSCVHPAARQLQQQSIYADIPAATPPGFAAPTPTGRPPKAPSSAPAAAASRRSRRLKRTDSGPMLVPREKAKSPRFEQEHYDGSSSSGSSSGSSDEEDAPSPRAARLFETPAAAHARAAESAKRKRAQRNFVPCTDLLYPIPEEAPSPTVSGNLEAYGALRLVGQVSDGDGYRTAHRSLTLRVDLLPENGDVCDATLAAGDGVRRAQGRCRFVLSYVSSMYDSYDANGCPASFRRTKTEIEALGVFREEMALSLAQVPAAAAPAAFGAPMAAAFAEEYGSCPSPEAGPTPEPSLTPGSMSSLSSASPFSSAPPSPDATILTDPAAKYVSVVSSDALSSVDDGEHGLFFPAAEKVEPAPLMPGLQLMIEADVMSVRSETQHSTPGRREPEVVTEEGEWQRNVGGFLLNLGASDEGFGVGSQLDFGLDFGFAQTLRKAIRLWPTELAVEPISLVEVLNSRRQAAKDRSKQRRRVLAPAAIARLRRLKRNIASLRQKEAEAVATDAARALE